jgi:hypothetical protein
MDITINFDNYNAGVDDGVKVYRSDSAILSASLPAPLATLPSGATQYIDTTAVASTTTALALLKAPMRYCRRTTWCWL